ncbi:hypothetical protein [uncultured Proteiniphilum sp.]
MILIFDIAGTEIAYLGSSFVVPLGIIVFGNDKTVSFVPVE